jgi:hypothetical protein
MLLTKYTTLLKLTLGVLLLITLPASKPSSNVLHISYAYELKQLRINYSVYPYISNFPQPFKVHYNSDINGYVKIKLDKIEFPYEVKIFNTQGKELSNTMYTFQKEIDVSLIQYERGSYIIEISTSNKKLYDYSMLVIK